MKLLLMACAFASIAVSAKAQTTADERCSDLRINHSSAYCYWKLA